MRKVIGVLVLLFLFSSFAFAEEEIIVGIYPNPPLLFEDENGEAAGLFVDVLNDFANHNALKLVYTFGSLEEIFKALEAGEIQWVPGIAYSTERDEKYYFNHEVLFINWGQVYSTTNSNIISMEDLINQRIGVQKSDIHYTGTYGIFNTLNQFGYQAEYVEFENKEDLFQALSENEIDAGVVNRIFGMLNEGQYEVTKTPIQLNPIRMHLISLDNRYEETFKSFDEYLSQLKGNTQSVYHVGIEKWFGNELTTKIPIWLSRTLLGLLAIVAVLILTVIYARYLVKVKTSEIRSLNQTLETKVIERTEFIKKQQEELVETSKMAALGQLVAGIAHEINTPIGVGITVSSHLEELTKVIQKKLIENNLTKSDFQNYMNDNYEGVGLILSNLQRAGDLIENFKQIAVDSHDIESDQLNIKSYTEMIVKSLRTQTKNSVNFDIVCDPNLSINTYAGSYSQVLNNLIMNSIIHGFENREDNLIQLSFEATEDGIILYYKDNGIGLNEAVKQNIFNPFYTTKRGEGGSGLGMHIVYNVVKNKLKGHIACIDGIENGAGFQIIFRDLGGDNAQQ